MKKLVLTGAVLSAFALAVAPGAQAQCGTSCQIGRLKSQVTTLRGQLSTVEHVTNALATCMGEAPITRYGDDTSNTFGYVYDSGGGNVFDTSALDGTDSGQPVSIWVMFDRCNGQVNASVRSHAVAGRAVRGHAAVAPQFSLGAALNRW